METLIATNVGHEVGYGNDNITRMAEGAFRQVFGDVKVFFVFAGTAANVLGLRTMANSYNGVICAETAHVHGSECGASENFIGCKLLPVPTQNGKITVADLERFKNEPDNPHSIQPKVVSLTQATEYGTIYRREEILAIADYAHNSGWLVHMDGARIANAACGAQSNLFDISGAASVDVLSFGGTKNGLMFGEAVVFFNTKLARNFPYVRMQGMQLASKMRFISAQFLALLQNDLWRKNAHHANFMAQNLWSKLGGIPYVYRTQSVETNQVFVKIPKRVVAPLQEEYFFYVWNDNASEYEAEVRFVTSWDTDYEEIDDFCDRLHNLIGRKDMATTIPIGEKGLAASGGGPDSEDGGIVRI